MLDNHPLTSYDPSIHTTIATNYYIIQALTAKTTATIVALSTEEGGYIEVIAVDLSPVGSTFIENEFWNLVEPLQAKYNHAWGNQLGFLVDSKEVKLALQRREYNNVKEPYLESGEAWINFKTLYTSRWMSLRKIASLEKTGRLSLMGWVDLSDVKDEALKRALFGLATLVDKDPYDL